MDHSSWRARWVYTNIGVLSTAFATTRPRSWSRPRSRSVLRSAASFAGSLGQRTLERARSSRDPGTHTRNARRNMRFNRQTARGRNWCCAKHGDAIMKHQSPSLLWVARRSHSIFCYESCNENVLSECSYCLSEAIQRRTVCIVPILPGKKMLIVAFYFLILQFLVWCNDLLLFLDKRADLGGKELDEGRLRRRVWKSRRKVEGRTAGCGLILGWRYNIKERSDEVYCLTRGSSHEGDLDVERWCRYVNECPSVALPSPFALVIWHMRYIECVIEQSFVIKRCKIHLQRRKCFVKISSSGKRLIVSAQNTCFVVPAMII